MRKTFSVIRTNWKRKKIKQKTAKIWKVNVKKRKMKRNLKRILTKKEKKWAKKRYVDKKQNKKQNAPIRPPCRRIVKPNILEFSGHPCIVLMHFSTPLLLNFFIVLVWAYFDPHFLFHVFNRNRASFQWEKWNGKSLCWSVFWQCYQIVRI